MTVTRPRLSDPPAVEAAPAPREAVRRHASFPVQDEPPPSFGYRFLRDVGRGIVVVVLRNPRDHSVDYVKRVVGLPGERVRIRHGVVVVDGRPLEPGFELIGDDTTMPELIVPSGHVFVLGDNRPVSCDSREFGLVQHELIKGKVRVRFWPLDRLSVF